jgi:TonB family protein
MTPPRALSDSPPEVPPEAKKAGREGAVTLQLEVDRHGRVTQAVVVEGAGHGVDEAAVAASGYLDVQNASNNATIEGIQYSFNYTARQYVGGLPISPSIGIRGER